MRTITDLMTHQVSAVDKLLPIRVGALFMDMGTGKTRTAIELIARRQGRFDRVLWLCPVSLKETIRHEIYKHTDAAPADVCVLDDMLTAETLPLATWFVIGLESVSGSTRVAVIVNTLITDQTFVIVDESSYIKGHRALRTQRITAFAARAKYRLVLTGTPLSQGVVDLFAQMKFLSPAILGYHSFYSFAANHLEYSEKYPGKIVRAHNTEHLAAKIQPYVYQVAKSECLTLQGKLHDAVYYSLTPEQQAAYWQAKDEFLPLLEAAKPWMEPYVLFQLFTALQEIISGFWNRNRRDGAGNVYTEEYPHRRMKMLADRLAAIPDDEKVIIWCRFQYSVRNIVYALSAKYGSEFVAQFHGGVSEHDRHAEIARWRAGGRFLVATQATGGHGLTLTEAHYAVFYENGFKYSERVQAEDRIHRIGQEQPCIYMDIVASESIDERIQKALHQKADVVNAFRRQVQQVRDKRDQAALRALVMEL
jgi:SNF2 family DNA or RNA helicase